MVSDHVVLLLDETKADYRFNLRIYVYRTWNKLSKLQKQLLFLMILFTCILYVLFGLTTSKDDFNGFLKFPENIFKVSDEYSVSENSMFDDYLTVFNNLEKAKKDKFNARQKEVINEFKFAWKNYKQYAWGHDILKPIEKSYKDDYHLGLSIVDSIDTMFLMDLKDEFKDAKNWIKNHLIYEHNKFISLFEVTIRVLGGLLSIYHLTSDRIFLKKALELGEKLSVAFNNHSQVPYSDVNFNQNIGRPPLWLKYSSTAEVATIQLEFRDLARSTNISKYEELVANVSLHIHKLNKTDGLVPIYISPEDGQFRQSTITLGARGDSYYEYLLKQWIQTGKKMDFLKDDYIKAIDGVEKHLVKRTHINNLLFIGEILNDNKFNPKMDHLTCFLPGTLMIGVQHGMPKKHETLAKDLMQTCYKMYEINENFLSGEIAYFRFEPSVLKDDIYIKDKDNYNLLRPEFIESLYYMYYYTNNHTYQDWGYKIFQAFLKHSKIDTGFLAIYNNKNNRANQLFSHDEMDSYFLSETLKYLFLLFDDDKKAIDLNKFVINSEGHPLPIYSY